MDCGWGFAAMQVTYILDPPVNSFCILLCILHTLHNLRDEKRYSTVILQNWSLPPYNAFTKVLML